MNYSDDIRILAQDVPITIVNFDQERPTRRPPTQAFSEFLTNREQGDWAERLIVKAINEHSTAYVAVQYGKSENLVAGEEGFERFYQNYQNELDEIGKRPDLLLFKRTDYEADWNFDISRFTTSQLNAIVPKAIAGLEIRSSSFLIEKYDAVMNSRIQLSVREALVAKNKLISDFSDVFQTESRKVWWKAIQSLDESNLKVLSLKVPGWRASERLIEANELLKKIKASCQIIQKRDFLSITPKVEDIKVVYKWIQTYNVPHYYFQVFFDKVYGISFKDILTLISNPDNEGVRFFVESQDAKNQNKATIKINSKIGEEIAFKVEMPAHESRMRELPRGRLLFYVTFEGGRAYLNAKNFLRLLNLNEGVF